jgi:hypothetical protein
MIKPKNNLSYSLKTLQQYLKIGYKYFLPFPIYFIPFEKEYLNNKISEFEDRLHSKTAE